MKTDVELMLPRKKEIILYATMSEQQRSFEQHLIDKTLEDHLRKNAWSGRGFLFYYKFFW